jgi:hypothetical protein
VIYGGMPGAEPHDLESAEPPTWARGYWVFGGLPRLPGTAVIMPGDPEPGSMLMTPEP